MKPQPYRNPACPQDAAHGPLLGWPTSIASWYCPNTNHTGGHFYRTDLTPSSPAPRPTPSSSVDPYPGAVLRTSGAPVSHGAGAPSERGR